VFLFGLGDRVAGMCYAPLSSASLVVVMDVLSGGLEYLSE